MCGRFLLDDNDDIADIRKIFEKLEKFYNDTAEFNNVKKGEIFPTDTVPVIIPLENFNLDVVPMQWGINIKINNGAGNGYRDNLIINARSETVYQKKMFRDSIINKRCVIPANGFYEWAKVEGKQKKDKYYIKPTESPMFYFAGIYERLPDPFAFNKEQIRFVIMTREARGHIRSIHDRMPVSVEKKDILKWLNGEIKHINEFFTDPKNPEYSFTNLGSAG